MKVKEQLLSDYSCNECKFCLKDGSCAVYTYDKPEQCNEFILKDADLPTDEYEYME